jgi:hypothetical protein
LNDEGLVAFLAHGVFNGSPYSDGGYRIVTKPDGTMSLMKFMEAMAAICIYGTADESFSNQTLMDLAKQRKLELRCGETVDFVHHCAQLVGIETRTARSVTADTPNNADDGHVMIEGKDELGNWVLFDVPGDACFYGSGDCLSLEGVAQNGIENCLHSPLADYSVNNQMSISGGWPSRVYWEIFHKSPADAEIWRNRIIQIPILDDENGAGLAYMPPGTESRQGYVEGLGFQVLSHQDWVQKFYDNTASS